VPVFLVLWDVDYTLVHTPKVGVYLYQLAFAELYGIELPHIAASANMAGRTDRAIVLEVLELAGIADPAGEVSRFEAALARLAPSTTGMVTELGRALPGVPQALTALHELTPSGVRQSLLTGNIRAMAEVKLAPFGLTEHLDLDIGAYGNESGVRAELVGHARKRASAAYGTDYSGEATVLIGDTPLDIEAALATGARGVGVATGRFTMDELAAAGAHAVLPDLSDTASALAAVLGPASLDAPSLGAPSRYQPRSA
jgi:phosphoglycolate phosphatase-like HAD superfamily hydrolase